MRLLVLALSLQAIVAQLVIIADRSGTGEDDQTVKTSFSSPAFYFHIGSCFRLRRVTWVSSATSSPAKTSTRLWWGFRTVYIFHNWHGSGRRIGNQTSFSQSSTSICDFASLRHLPAWSRRGSWTRKQWRWWRLRDVATKISWTRMKTHQGEFEMKENTSLIIRLVNVLLMLTGHVIWL